MSRKARRSTRAILGVALALCLPALTAAPASAGDANSLPPTVVLEPSGSDGVVSPLARSLAYFSTPATGLDDFDESWEYLPGSQVTFSCAIDARPVKCEYEYVGTESGGGGFLRAARQSRGEKVLPGFFAGSVPLPKGLADGPHTVTVVATDEDGTDPNPPTVEATLDREPPTKPVLIAKPPKRSRIHKPNFRFRSEDEIRFVTSRADSFFARLRRVRPDREVFTRRGEAGFFSPWTQSCPTLLTCTGQAKVVYFVPGFGGLGLGMAEWLPAGLYEIFVRARDAAGNKSPLTRYRFRILPGGRGR